jgi:hypothetical protein
MLRAMKAGRLPALAPVGRARVGAEALPGRGLTAATDARPLVVHVVYRFDTGGLENGVVNLINHMPAPLRLPACRGGADRGDRLQAARPARRREFICAAQAAGHGGKLYPKLYRLFRQLRPAVVHTRNLARWKCRCPAGRPGVPVRVHGEHGRDVGDLDGSSRATSGAPLPTGPSCTTTWRLSRDLASATCSKVGIRRAHHADLQRRGQPALPPARGRAPLPFGLPLSTTRGCGWWAPWAACRR